MWKVIRPVWLVLALSADAGEIVYSRYENGRRDLHVVDSDTGAARVLTTHPAQDVSPEWSPQGDRIVFASDRDGAFHLFVIDADGGNLRRLTDRDDHSPTWSPDGREIAFSSGRERTSSLYLMDANGENVRRLSMDLRNDDFQPSWSPDGRYIAFRTNRPEPYLALDTTTGRFVPFAGRRLFSNRPAWLPDSKQVVLGNVQAGAQGLFAVHVETDDVRELLAMRVSPHFAEVSPDGREVVYEEYVERRGVGRQRFAFLNLEDGSVRRFENEEASGGAYMSWSDPKLAADRSGKRPFTWGWLKRVGGVR